MPTFNEFADWLFPGDELPRTANPAVPAAIVPLLEEVQCKTGVPIDWLEKTSQFVINGLAGAQCLWFLHGAKGTLIEEPRTDEIGVPTRHDELDHALTLELYDLYAAHQAPKKGLASVEGTYFEWADGYLIEASPPNKKARRLKLGKWLRKMGASPALRKAFETRKLGHWGWEVSAHPYDVLTMSFRRPWTSCMRPPDPEGGKEAGEAQYGPLTDLAAGSAVVFFSRPGAAVPCGRLMLRPALAHYGDGPIIVSGHRIYGCGPGSVLPVEQLQQMLTSFLPSSLAVSSQEPYLCSLGADGRALSRFIYSDTDNNFCQQNDEKYDEAYAALVAAPWPEPQVPMEDVWSVAAEFQGAIDTSEVVLGLGVSIDVEEVADGIADGILRDLAPLQIYEILLDVDEDTETLAFAVIDQLPDPDAVSADIFNDLRHAVYDHLHEWFFETLVPHSDVVVLALPGGTAPENVQHHLDTLPGATFEYSDHDGYFDIPQLAYGAVNANNVGSDLSYAAEWVIDGQPIGAFVLVLAELLPNMTASPTLANYALSIGRFSQKEDRDDLIEWSDLGISYY